MAAMKGPQKAPIRHRLPADSHVHSEFSWDGGSDPAAPGRLRRTCEQAVRSGVPAVVFTEHLDLAESWWAEPADLGEHAGRYVGADGYARLPGFDLEGYLAEIEHCRADFPGLRILTGIEYGQPHLHDDASDALRRGGRFDRVNGSLHTLPFPESPGGGSADRTEPTTLYRFRPAADVMTAYLEELPRMITGSDTFEVLTHIDYAVRSWPAAAAGPFDPHAFEEGFRAAMRALAESGRALELNTRRLWPWIPQWWRERLPWRSPADSVRGAAPRISGRTEPPGFVRAFPFWFSRGILH
jgi:histidinol-phosphatase (PHP family)